jgi:hypothetical protein
MALINPVTGQPYPPSSHAQVDSLFGAAQSYSANATQGAQSFLAALNTSIYAPPTVQVTWESIAPPSLEALPDLPSMPTISVNFPTDTPQQLMLDIPVGEIDDFDVVMPDTNFGTAPTISYGVIPTVPSIGSVDLPEMGLIELPNEPSMLSLATVSFAGVDLRADWLTKLEDIPEMTLVEPTPYSYGLGPEYASALLDSLKAVLVERMTGGTGLDPAVEQAIWGRARDRETRISQANIDEIQRQSDALGFDLPSGTLATQMRQAQQDYYDKLSTLSRDVAIKQAELEQENLKQTIAAGMQLESQLMDHSYKLEQLTFENAKQYAENAIQVYNAGVEGYKGLIAGYTAYAQTYKTIIDAELSKVEVYKAELQAEMTKAQINQALVSQYKASIDAQMSKVEIYKAQVSAAQTLVQLESTKISAAGEQVKAYVAQVNAETAKVEAYKAGVQAEATKVEVFKSSVQAYSAKVGAQAEKAKADISRYTALQSAKAAEWDGYKARVQAEAERIRALGIQSGALLDGFKAGAAAVESKSRMTTQVWETQIKQYEAGQNISLQGAKINNDAWMQARNAQLDAAKVGAQVYAQLSAAAYSTISASASISGSSSDSYSHNFSYEM